MRRPSVRLQAGGGTLKDSLHLIVEFLRVLYNICSIFQFLAAFDLTCPK